MSLKLTPGGIDLLLRTVAGEASVNFRAIKLGNGADAGESATNLSNPLLTVEITGSEVGDVFVTLTATFSNSDVSAGFRATELGVYADDPDSPGSTLLYAYEYTPDAEADYIPAGADRMLETQLDVAVYIGDAENVTASISQSTVYAGKAELSAHTENKSNPHKVTKEQVGLGNVPNVETNDQTVTYTAPATLTALTSGETLSTALGKLKTAVSQLMGHLNKNAQGVNVHKETAKSIGAAESEHKHSTADIIEGILSAARGGTGSDVIDQSPVKNSGNMVTSGGVYASLDALTAQSIKVGKSLSSAAGCGESDLLSALLADLFTSVSNGKAVVASAITDKGVTTASDAAFQTMANNIAAIQTGGGGSGGITKYQVLKISANSQTWGTKVSGGVFTWAIPSEENAVTFESRIVAGWLSFSRTGAQDYMTNPALFCWQDNITMIGHEGKLPAQYFKSCVELGGVDAIVDLDLEGVTVSDGSLAWQYSDQTDTAWFPSTFELWVKNEESGEVS